MRKVFDEVEKKLGSADVPAEACPWPSDPLPNQTASPHFFYSDAPDDNETCVCGRFFFIAAKTIAGE